MTTTDTDTSLPDDIEAAHRLIRELLATLREQTDLNANLQHQLEQLLRKLHGRKSEKLDPNQLLLFAREILEAGGPEITPEPQPATPAPEKPPAKGHGRKPLPTSLPRKTVLHDVPPEQRPCPDCGEVRQPFGEEVREQLEQVPASLIVLRHVRPKYACKACAANVVIAERLPEPIEKGLPGPGLMAHMAVSKYADHLPLYRQEGILKRFGVELSRSTLCDWMATAAGLLEPIVREMLKRVLMSEVVQTDDTPVKVQDHDGKGIKVPPPKRVPQTDAIFEQLKRVNPEADRAGDTLRISIDAKATVNIGPFSRRGRSRTGTKAADHDFKPEGTLTPFGILLPEHDDLWLYMARSKVTSDFIVDRLEQWWEGVRLRFLRVKMLVINLDNGPENHSRRTQFLKRIVGFARKYGLVVQLAYYPPYHSKYGSVAKRAEFGFVGLTV